MEQIPTDNSKNLIDWFRIRNIEAINSSHIIEFQDDVRLKLFHLLREAIK